MAELYSSKKILAPMVRAGRTPLRMLALDYGVDLVYTEEIVDQKLLGSHKIKNDALGTVDFINGDEIVLRIATGEKPKCVLQIGTNSTENAAKICQLFGEEVAAIDVNMGCPKPFSVHAGMGAALLSDPIKAKEILTSMVSVSSVPISCKIRVLDSHEKTMEFVQMVERCGVSALAVHGRRRDERPAHKCRLEEIREICRAITSIPVIANGGSREIKRYEDIEHFREQTGASSVMVARKAFTNPSIFRQEGMLGMDEEIQNFLTKACQFDENFTAVKYVVQRILGSQQEFDPRGRRTVASSTVREICRIWGMEEHYLECRNQRRNYGHQKPEDIDQNGSELCPKRIRMENGQDAVSSTFTLIDGIFTANLSFQPKRLKRGLYGADTPRCELNKYCNERRIDAPTYQTIKRQQDARFTTIATVNGKQFRSTVPQPNIKMAEQVAALVALYGLDIRHRLKGEWEEDC